MTHSLAEYVLTAKTAKILGVSQNSLRAWTRAGKIPIYLNPANG